VRGIDIVGPFPPPLQTLTYFSAGIAAQAKNPQAARQLIGLLTSEETRAAMIEGGMQPAADQPRDSF
jgi:molybdate transport system substrate-binding protein